jgi:leucine dehydrogenase
MGLFELTDKMGHEQVVYCNDPETGLKAIIAIHDTTLGPALGGCRFWDYQTEEEALVDVLRLSRGMTYKAAVAGLPLGGGKAVIIGDSKKLKSEAFFRSFGKFVNSLEGRYITAEDVNIKVQDINYVGEETKYVSGVTTREHGSGDPSPVTAYGVFQGIKASVKHQLNTDSLKGVRVAVQGTGAVGSYLCGYLKEEGADLTVADINQDAVKAISEKFDAKIMDTHTIHSADVDVFAPCALGGIINDDTIPQLKAKIVAGGANNQLLEEDRHGMMLRESGILYAPDYVINAGGLINVCGELKQSTAEESLAEAKKIYDTMLGVYQEADAKNISTHVASDLIAEARIAEAKKSRAKMSQNFNNQDWIKV